jgi:cation transport regulator ChaC
MLPDTATWVFGYGSLIWKQDFPFLEARNGYVEGWARRFWQGSHDHRGLQHAPGRVVTLVPAPGERCHGRAFLVEPAVFEHLDHREKNGYVRVTVDIHFSDFVTPGVFYFADRQNEAWLGPASMAEMAAHIAGSAGPSGANRDYVVELAAALRAMGVDDPHVFTLESLL